jgi:hypothetical protein
LNAALANWKTLTPEYLLLPENATLLDGLRQRAKDTSRSDVRVPLLRMDDADTVRSALEELRSEYWSRRRRATSQLTIAANPKVIAMLADDLMKDANPKDELVDDINVPSTSVVAARIVRATVLSSQEFSANAKAWANRLPPDPVGLTEGVRVWWQQHREALEKMDFRSVLPDAVPGTLRPRFCTGSNHNRRALLLPRPLAINLVKVTLRAVSNVVEIENAIETLALPEKRETFDFLTARLEAEAGVVAFPDLKGLLTEFPDAGKDEDFARLPGMPREVDLS